MNRLRFFINSARIALALWLLPEVKMEHICDRKQEAFPWACPECGRVVCHNFGGTDGKQCDDCWDAAFKKAAA